MAIKKTDLYTSIWKSCDELRGGMDASQYKDYVLVLLFVKYVSDKFAGEKDGEIQVPEGASFKDMVALKGDKEIGDKINKIIGALAGANNLTGVIDQTDFNDEDKLGRGKEMVDRLSNLVAIFESPGLDFSRSRTDGDDLLGDAYEYLMQNFAEQSGKSKGQFYTPAEVSRIMAKVIGLADARDNSQTIYDPTCGSGSLLIKAHDEAKRGSGVDLALYGQEKDNATAGLARMNMILHRCTTAEIWNGNTLSDPHFKEEDGRLKLFDFAVANPPFSDKAWRNGLNPAEDEFRRFSLGVPPAKNGDYAFFLHLLSSLKSTGKGAIILPHGVLFRGHAEAEIRREIVRRAYIRGIIGLPPNLFFGTGIPACIVVLDKQNAAARKGVFMIDASRGFMKDGAKNRLRERDIHKIVEVFTEGLEVSRYSRMVSMDEIEANGFNLNIPRYIDSSELEDLQDISAHLHGGIPERDIDALDEYWQVLPGVRSSLFSLADRPGYVHVRVPASEVRATVLGHPDFRAFQDSVTALWGTWSGDHVSLLESIDADTKPKRLIEILSEDLLQVFRRARLVDSYALYQHLMTYWSETMQDDVYMIAADGWRDAARLRVMVDDRGGKDKADLVIGKIRYKAEPIPPALIVARYFADEQLAVDALEEKVVLTAQRLDELRDENSGEDGLLAGVNEDGKISRSAILARLKEIADDKEFEDEHRLLGEYLSLLEQQSDATRRAKDSRKQLEAHVEAKYGELTLEEIKILVVSRKWLATLAAGVQSELDRVSRALTLRVRELAERYEFPLSGAVEEVAFLSARVEEHLRKMGAIWK